MKLAVTSVGPLLTLGGAPVAQQEASNPQLVADGASGALLACVGIDPMNMVFGLVGEALHTVKVPADPYVYLFRLLDAPALAFPPCVPPQTWADVGGFGGGFALYHPAENRWCAAASLGFGVAAGGPKKGIAWLESRDGLTWSALRGGEIADNNEYRVWDSDPTPATLIIHRDNYGADEPFTGGRIWHPAGYYGRDNRFYLFIGLSGAAGINVHAFRFASPLGGMEWFRPQAGDIVTPSWVPFDGVLTDAIMGSIGAFADYPPGDPADMHCLCPLTNADGSDGGLLAFYHPAQRGAFDSDFAYRYSRSSLPPWSWSDQQTVDLGPLASVPLTRSGPGGQSLAVAQLRPGDATLLAYLATSTEPSPTTGLLQLGLSVSPGGTP